MEEHIVGNTACPVYANTIIPIDTAVSAAPPIAAPWVSQSVVQPTNNQSLTAAVHAQLPLRRTRMRRRGQVAVYEVRRKKPNGEQQRHEQTDKAGACHTPQWSREGEGARTRGRSWTRARALRAHLR